jgi:hypothetical protein
MANVKHTLRVVRRPVGDHEARGSHIVDDSLHRVDFVCGGCGTLLMHAEEGHVEGVLIHCTQCGACNITDDS